MGPEVRVDKGLGLRQEVEFFGAAGSRLFGSRFVPMGGASAGVVICSPILAEFPKNYRREVLLSRALALRGLVVQRFHYRGAGHSDGDVSELTFATMCDDALAASELAVRSTGIECLGFLGTRLGAMVAAVAARSHAGAPLALWEPVLSPPKYVRDVFRARMMSELRQGASRPTPADAMLAEMNATGRVDVLGYPIERSLYDSLAGHDLARALGEVARPVLLVELGSRAELRPEYAALAVRLQHRGWPVRSAVLGSEEEAWWFVNDPWKSDDVVSKSTSLLEVTADWLAGAMTSLVPS